MPHEFKRGRFDLESDGLLDVVTKVHCLSLKLDKATTALYVGHAEIRRALALLDRCHTIVAHNGIAFDLMVLWKIFRWKPKAPVVEDTMILSCLIHPDIEGGHSLEEWGLRVGQPKQEYTLGWSEYSETMGQYCVGDTDTLAKVDDRLLKDREGWGWDASVKMEHQFAKDFAVQGWRGVLVDKPHCLNLLQKIDDEMAEIAQLVEPLLPERDGTKGQLKEVTPPKLQFKKDGTPSGPCRKWFEEVKPMPVAGTGDPTPVWHGFKYGVWHRLPTPMLEDGSSRAPLRTKFPATLADQQHIKTWLMDMGWKPTMWSFKKDSKTGKYVRGDNGQLVPTWPKFHDKGELCKALEEITSEFEHVRKVVRWVVIRHRRGLVQSIVNAIRADGTVPATGFALGTPTSRVTHQVVANIPKAEPEVVYGKECRAMFIARPGRRLVGVDAAGLELRCLAHYVGTPEIVKMIVEGKKEDGTEIHTFLWNACKEWVKSRTVQKNVNYGWLYGASDKKLGQTAGHPDGTAEKIGKKIRAALVKAVPGLEALMQKIDAAAKVGYIKAIDGRRIAIRAKHATLNTLLQSCGSILVKWAQCYMNAKIRERRLDAWQVISYHDEVQLDCHPAHAEEAGQLFIEGLQWAGRRFKVYCPLDGEVKVGYNWADTH